MLFAFFGYPELTLAAGVGALALALPILLLLVQRKAFKRIPVVAVPAVLIAASAGVMYYREVTAPPPLICDMVLLIDDSPRIQPQRCCTLKTVKRSNGCL